jgi:hypothetical protein
VVHVGDTLDPQPHLQTCPLPLPPGGCGGGAELPLWEVQSPCASMAPRQAGGMEAWQCYDIGWLLEQGQG